MNVYSLDEVGEIVHMCIDSTMRYTGLFPNFPFQSLDQTSVWPGVSSAECPGVVGCPLC